MYGYVRQPDGVLKPILLKNIKNIVVSGNSLDIVYFSVGTTPLEIPRVDQQHYFDTGVIKACSLANPGSLPEVYKNDIYSFGDTDFVNGDIKINFGPTHLDVYKTFTEWMNSILSGKTTASTDKTLNEFAPSLKVGYVFSNESSLPTAMLQKVETDGDPCSVEISIAESKTVFVAADMVANTIPLVGTHIYEELFEDTTLTTSLAPIAEDGVYILYQFIAPTSVMPGYGPGAAQPACQQPSPGDAQIKIWGNLLSPQLDNVKYTVTIKNSAIAAITVCPEEIQMSFSPYKTGKAFAYNSTCDGTGVWPYAVSNFAEQAGLSLADGATYEFSEYWVRQESGDEFVGVKDINKPGAFIPDADINTPSPTQFVTMADVNDNNVGSICVPTTRTDNSYPARIYQSVINGQIRSEFGITGINMSILEIPEIPNPFAGPGDPPTYQGGLVMNGIPTALTNTVTGQPHPGGLYALSGSAGNTIQDTSANSLPIFWDNGAPSKCDLPNGQTNVDCSYATLITPNSAPGAGGSIRVRCISRPNASWEQIFHRDNGNPGQPGVPTDSYFQALMFEGIIPGGEAQFSGPPQLAHNIKVWFRDVLQPDPKAPVETGDWIEFRPSLLTSTALPAGMVNNVQQPGNPFSDPYNIPREMMTIPFAVPETEKILLDAGYTHRAFGVGSYAGFSMSIPGQISYNKGKFRGLEYNESSNQFIGDEPWSWSLITFPNEGCGAQEA